MALLYVCCMFRYYLGEVCLVQGVISETHGSLVSRHNRSTGHNWLEHMFDQCTGKHAREQMQLMKRMLSSQSEWTGGWMSEYASEPAHE